MEPGEASKPSVGGPVSRGWRECTLTRAAELETLCRWALGNDPPQEHQHLADAVAIHIESARQAAKAAKLDPARRFYALRNGSLRERAMSNLDAAETLILNFAPVGYMLGKVPCVVRAVRCHLITTDPRRQELDRIAKRLGLQNGSHPLLAGKEPDRASKELIITEERGTIVTAYRGAMSAALREQVRVRSFGTVLVVTTVLMFLLAAGVALLGAVRPTAIAMCFAPEEAATVKVVCPLRESASFPATQQPGGPQTDIDVHIRENATHLDLFVVELVGLIAAAVAAATAISKIRGSSERNSIPVALAVLKLPTGAVTALLGLLLMRGQFVPGLSALDTPAQILAWALVFGFAQEVFTRLVDRQANVVLDSVRGAEKQPADLAQA
jgi:hypothetical protein